MKAGGKRFFYNHPERLNRLIDLYESGLSKSKISRVFGLDHTSVIYWIKKLNLKRENNPRIALPPKRIYKRIIIVKIPKHPYGNIIFENECFGKKNYKDYLAEKRLKLHSWNGIKYATHDNR